MSDKNSLQPLGKAEIEDRLGKIKGWQVSEGRKIYKEFKFPDFEKALTFVNEVGKMAEEENHHPEIHLSWGRVMVEISTHHVSRLSEKDFILAAKIDKI